MSKKKNKKSVEAQEQVQSEESLETIKDAMDSIEIEASIFLSPEEEGEGFLPEVSEEEMSASEETVEASESEMDLSGTELDQYQSEEIEEIDFIEDEQVESIIESILFASDRPVSLASIVEVFKKTNIKKDRIRKMLDSLAVEYAGGRRGVTLEEITGGYQLRTKIDNMNFIKGTLKTRTFKLSGPALETLSIVAYKQPVVKSELDQIRGVESGHLLRALMEKGLVNFEGKAENLPGRPMQYGTTRKFLEIFGLRNLKELPTLSQIDELLPEGITEDEAKPTLSMVTDSMSQEVKTVSYSEGEEELGKIENELSEITTSSDFFEQEKIRQKQKRDAEKAQDIRDAMAVGEEVSTRDKNWLAKYEEALNAPVVEAAPESVDAAVDAAIEAEASEETVSEENSEEMIADAGALEDAEFIEDETEESEMLAESNDDISADTDEEDNSDLNA